MAAILSAVSLIMRDAMEEDEFWDALQCGEVQHRCIVYAKDSDFGYYVLCLEYGDIVILKDWFGFGIMAEDTCQRNARLQLFTKLTQGEYCVEGEAISVMVTDSVYGEISLKFSSRTDDDTALRVRLTV